ncbi:MAG: HAD family hydrolase [Polaromonas sp.]
MFHAAAGAVDVSPEHVLHIGDDPGLDVLGALNAGMQTVWLNRPDHAWMHDSTPHLSVTSLKQLCDYMEADQQLSA